MEMNDEISTFFIESISIFRLFGFLGAWFPPEYIGQEEKIIRLFFIGILTFR